MGAAAAHAGPDGCDAIHRFFAKLVSYSKAAWWWISLSLEIEWFQGHCWRTRRCKEVQGKWMGGLTFQDLPNVNILLQPFYDIYYSRLTNLIHFW